MIQQNIFSQKVAKQINNFSDSGRAESKTSSATVKLTETQKTALSAFSSETGVGMSRILSDALDLYFVLYPHGHKVSSHKEVLHQLLSTW